MQEILFDMLKLNNKEAEVFWVAISALNEMHSFRH